MNDKKRTRHRRARRGRMKMREQGATRLSVTRTPRHIYAQVLSADGGTVLARASTLEKDLRDGTTGNVEAAAKVGALIADRAKQAGIETVFVISHLKQAWVKQGTEQVPLVGVVTMGGRLQLLSRLSNMMIWLEKGEKNCKSL